MKDVAVRHASIRDEQDLHEIWSWPGVVRDTLQLPYVTPDKTRKWLENPTEGDHFLVAEVDGRIVGSLSLNSRRDRLSHMGHIGIGVHDDFQNQGIGWLNLKRVELHVYTDNARAVHLYKKFGFEIEGVRRNFLRYDDGTLLDDIMMAKYL